MNHHPRSTDITLELDNICLAISPQSGGSITKLAVRNSEGLWASVFRDMPLDSTDASDAGSFSMIPWSNRIQDAQFEFQDQKYSIKSNCDDGSAIHGVTRKLPWTITDRSPIHARLVFNSSDFGSFADQSSVVNYPFAFGAIQRFEIAPGEVHLEISITNLDSRPIPVGYGFHPYIHRHLFSNTDTLRVQMDLAGRYPTQGCIPTGQPVDDDVCRLFRENQTIGNSNLDDVFSGYGGRTRFYWDQSKVSMEFECSSDLNHMVVYTPQDEHGEPDEYICVEPVSMVNNGFNMLAQGSANTGTQVLEPGESVTSRMSVRFDFHD